MIAFRNYQQLSIIRVIKIFHVSYDYNALKFTILDIINVCPYRSFVIQMCHIAILPVTTE